MRYLLFLLLLTLSCSPQKDQRSWIERAVDREFAYYSNKKISQHALDTAWTALRRKPEFCRYKIIDSQVYGRPGNIKNLLEALVQTYPVPDVDFIYFNEDRIKKSFAARRPARYAAPIFVSAKDRSLTQFILFSDWLYNPKDHLSGWNAILQSVNENQTPWSSKTSKLFWRGSPFDGKHFGMYTFDNWKTIPRGQLVYQSRLHPELIDAAFSSYPRHCLHDPERSVQEMGAQTYVSQSEQLRYKYHLLIDGVTCTYPATHWKLLSGSLIFKQDSPDIMYFYPELIPYEHYIPVRRDLSDLTAKILWAKSHEEQAEQIAINARNFALTRLMPEHILAYCHAVLLKYASLQSFQPTLNPTDSGREF